MDKRKNRKLLNFVSNPKYLMVLATIGIFLVIYAFGAIVYGAKGFTKLRTFTMLFVDNAYIGISAVGMTMVLITGGIDLSVAAVASLTGMFLAYGTTVLGLNPWLCMAFSVFVGIALGLGMGALVTYLKIPPFVATLTGMFLARGVCSLISRESISINNEVIDALAGWKVYFMKYSGGEWVKIKPVAYINLNVVLFIVMILLGTYILQKTRFGRNVYAIGGNEQSARLMGLPVDRTKMMVYGFNGLCSALAGIAYALYVKSGWNLALQGGELDVISAAVIGGVLLCLITFNGTLSSWWGKIITGLLVLLFVALQQIVMSRSRHGKKAKAKVKTQGRS